MSSNKNKNEENRAVAYVRVSSQRQVDEGVSIAAQTRRIKDYAHFKGLSLADNDIFIDEGISGGVPLWQRPQGGAMHRRMLRENIPHLISLKIDRMFRMVSDALITVDELSSEGFTLHVVDLHGEPVDTSSPTGRFFLTILAAMAEMERGLISERTQMGMDYLKATQKKFTRAIYGWDTTNEGSLVPNWNEQNVIDYMRWMLGLGVTASSIAKELNKQGIKGKLGGKWYGSSVLNTVRNDFHQQRKKYNKPHNWGEKEWHDAVPW